MLTRIRAETPAVLYPISPARRSRLFWIHTLALSLSLTLAFGGCGGGKKEAAQSSKDTGALSDTAAYRSALSQADTTARIGALTDFLHKYTSSPFRAAVYSRLYSLMEAQSPPLAESFVRDHLKTEKDPAARGRLYYSLYDYVKTHAPEQETSVLQMVLTDNTPDADVYNMIGWDLVERGANLDQAVQIATIGTEKAADSSSKSSVLDTRGWAYFAKQEFAKAVADLEQAVALSPEWNEEVEQHLATAYDKSGMKREASELYKKLLFTQEDPDMRARLAALTHDQAGSVKAVFEEIDKERKSRAKPAPDFALKDYEGREIHLADFKGKVVLLNFWHPT